MSTNMAASMRSKLGQNDLRKLMRESKSSSKASKIDSPLVNKYNDNGQLMCILCNCQIKSELLWSAHVRGRNHKEKLSQLKKPQKEESASLIKSSAIKRKHDDPIDRQIPEKQNKGEAAKKTSQIPPDFFDVKVKPSENIVNTDSSSDEDDSESVSNTTLSEEKVPSKLPADFFDGDVSNSSKADSVNAKKSETEVTNKVEDLPEGFFDDPIVDAKVRKIEYKDPMDEEWDKFQKMLSAESNVSQAIMDEDIEESKAEREIDEIDEQIHNWSRVEALQKKREEIDTSDLQKDNEEPSGSSSADEQEFEEFLDWRSKKVR